LLLRRNLDKSELKFYFSNAPAKTPPRKLARVGAMRWCIETAFEQGKDDGGLDEYEVRTWPGWYHHITLVLVAMAFLLLLTQEWGEKGARPHAAPGALARADAVPPSAMEC
jgi:SRSO17 transposase